MSAEHQGGHYWFGGVANRCRRELVELVLVLREKRDQIGVDDVFRG